MPAIKRMLVVMPTWLGDCVMATPTLRALRQLVPQAHISALIKSNVRPLLDDCPWIDRVLTIRPRRHGQRDTRRRGGLRLAKRLSRGYFDTAVLLPNSFRTAMIVSVAGIARRVGYDRDGRGFMLTDRLLPRRDTHGYVPTPARDYYLGLAKYLGVNEADPSMQLFIGSQAQHDAETVLQRAGVGNSRGLILLNPGASKNEKRWSSRNFAALADRLNDAHDVDIAVTGSPREIPLLNDVVRAATSPVINLAAHDLSLSSLKAIIARAQLLITNDTGPRHIAAALDTPLITLFGPTDPAWTQIDFPLEHQIIAADRTMAGISIDTVFDAAQQALCRDSVKG